MTTHCPFRTYGAALLVLNEEDHELLQMYMKYVRPHIKTQNKEALVTKSGMKLTSYKDFVKSLMTRFGITNFTEVRKAGATAMSGESSKEEMAVLSEHMTHSVPTSQKYYRSRSRIEVAKKVHKAIVGVTG